MLDAALASGAVPDAVDRQVHTLHRTFEAFTAGSARISASEEIVTTRSNARLPELIAADAALAVGLDEIADDLGPLARATLRAIRGSAGTHRFDATVDLLIVDLLAGRTSYLSDDQVAYAETFYDGARWFGDLIGLVAAASADLTDVASEQAAADERAFRVLVGLLVLVVAISLITVAALSRAITRPLEQVAAVIKAVHDGTFDLPPLPPKGPRELADTTLAVNEMATTLGAVESRSLALADQLDATHDWAPLPGRTGRALQFALDRLQDLASHDRLTSLLNRGAALDAVEREFARGRREGHPVMALFLDLDGLKAINDTYGHRAGDDAISVAAGVLARVCRDTDVLARIGGDEFLVAGVAPGGREQADALAARIDAEMQSAVLHVEGTAIAIRFSIGVALADPMTSTVDALIDDADAAMYVRKFAARVAIADGWRGSPARSAPR